MQRSLGHPLRYRTGPLASTNADMDIKVGFLTPAPQSEFLSLSDYIDVANVISNYSAANIPLETMWTDIGKLLFLQLVTDT